MEDKIAKRISDLFKPTLKKIEKQITNLAN